MPNDSRERLREIYNAFLEGHFQFLLDEVIHDDIEFVSNAPSVAFPYYGRGKGKAALLAKWKASRIDYEFLGYTPLLAATEGAEAAAVVVRMQVKARASGRVLDLLLADFIKFRDGRVIEFRQFMDTGNVTEQWLGRELDISEA